MQELRQESEIRWKAQSKVGTINANSLNYSRNIPAFDVSNIPIIASDIKSEIKQSVAKDILNTKKSQWNPSVLLDRSREYHQQISLNQLHYHKRIKYHHSNFLSLTIDGLRPNLEIKKGIKF